MFALDPAGAAIGGWQPGGFAGFEVVVIEIPAFENLLEGVGTHPV